MIKQKQLQNAEFISIHLVLLRANWIGVASCTAGTPLEIKD